MKNSFSKYLISAFIYCLVAGCSEKGFKSYQFGDFTILVPGQWKLEERKTIEGGSSSFVLPSGKKIWVSFGALTRDFSNRFPLGDEIQIDSTRSGDLIVYSRMQRSGKDLIEFYIENEREEESKFHISGSDLSLEERGLLISVVRMLRYTR